MRTFAPSRARALGRSSREVTKPEAIAIRRKSGHYKTKLTSPPGSIDYLQFQPTTVGQRDDRPAQSFLYALPPNVTVVEGSYAPRSVDGGDMRENSVGGYQLDSRGNSRAVGGDHMRDGLLASRHFAKPNADGPSRLPRGVKVNLNDTEDVYNSLPGSKVSYADNNDKIPSGAFKDDEINWIKVNKQSTPNFIKQGSGENAYLTRKQIRKLIKNSKGGGGGGGGGN